MKVLHTSDWHVGKVLKGLSRLEEQRQVLAEIVTIAAEERVDLVLIAGDVFDSTSPRPDSQSLVWSTVLDLHETGAAVVVIAGNHDNGHMLEALSPLAGAAGIRVLGRVKTPSQGGLVEVVTTSGDQALIACLPFISQRYVVHAADLMDRDAAQNAANYADRYRAVVEALCRGFTVDAVNLLVAHVFARGAQLGGGERPAQVIEDYWVDPTVFPPAAQYVALGHLHRTQQLPGAAPIWYSGSPIQVDFGEGGDTKNVLIVDVLPGAPAQVTVYPLHTPRRLRTIEGSLAELAELASEVGDDLLKVIVSEPRRAGLADDVRELLPNALDIRLESTDAVASQQSQRSNRSPHELFAAYLAESNVNDERVELLFAKLLDEVVEDSV